MRAIKERPILFSAPMVRALLDGSKTQTRRVMKLQPDSSPTLFFGQDAVLRAGESFKGGALAIWGGESEFEYCDCHCPYGRTADRLWVRETWGTSPSYDYLPPNKLTRNSFPTDAEGYAASATSDTWVIKWRPSIHMPRWASRLTLEIVEVRVERLQDISEEDAKAEGCRPDNMDTHGGARDVFIELWESINGPGSWDANPWVWVIEFERITP